MSDETPGLSPSMPAEYERAFSSRERGIHESYIRQRRRGEPLVRLVSEPGAGRAAFMVVADDEPGLLSLICAAFVTEQLDVVKAQIFARRHPDGFEEAVDFFEVRDPTSSRRVISEDRALAVERSLGELLQSILDGEVPSSLGSISHSRLRTPTRRPPAFDTKARDTSVYFDRRDLAEGRSVLVLEALDAPRLLLSVTKTIHGMGVQIRGSEIETRGSYAYDRFWVEKAGEPLESEDQGELCRRLEAVLLERRPRELVIRSVFPVA